VLGVYFNFDCCETFARDVIEKTVKVIYVKTLYDGETDFNKILKNLIHSTISYM